MGEQCCQATSINGRFVDSGRLIVAFSSGKGGIKFKTVSSDPFPKQTKQTLC